MSTLAPDHPGRWSTRHLTGVSALPVSASRSTGLGIGENSRGKPVTESQ